MVATSIGEAVRPPSVGGVGPFFFWASGPGSKALGSGRILRIYI